MTSDCKAFKLVATNLLKGLPPINKSQTRPWEKHERGRERLLDSLFFLFKLTSPNLHFNYAA